MKRFSLFIFALILPALSYAVAIYSLTDIQQMFVDGLNLRGKAPVIVSVKPDKPVIAFVDLTSAPRDGWSAAEPNKGAVVTVWGRNLGTTRGSNFITVGGVNLTANTDYPEAWGTYWPTPHLQKITFHLNSSIPLGDTNITVTVNGIESNSIPININDDDIFFVNEAVAGTGTGTLTDPYKSVFSFFTNATAGDVAYLRGGTYSAKIDGGQSTWYIRQGGASAGVAIDGTQAKPLGISAYPNETPIIDALDTQDSTKRTAIAAQNDWYTFSRLTVHADQIAISGDGIGVRIVGNDTVGVKTNQYGAGTIVGANDSVKILGNSVHGGRSANRLDHGVYASGCSPNDGMEIAYNHFYDNSLAEGPIIVVNHQDDRCGAGQYLKSHYIHSNFVDCSDFRSRAIGVYDQSWDVGDAQEPEPTYVYNNISVSCGIDRTWAAFTQNSAHVEWYNNTVYDSTGVALEIAGTRVLSSKVSNNIFDMSADFEIVRPHSLTGTPPVIIDTNIYYGSNGGLTAPETLDPNAVFLDPAIVLDLPNASITNTTAAYGVGLSNATINSLIVRDYNLVTRPTAKSIGAIDTKVTATFGNQSSTFAADNGFDFAETFDGLQSWTSLTQLEGNYSSVLSLQHMPKLEDGSASAWSYFSEWSDVPQNTNVKWIDSYGDDRVWRGSKSATIDIGETGLGPSRLGMYFGDGYDDFYVFFMVKIPKNMFPTSCAGGSCSTGSPVGTYTEGGTYQWLSSWKFFTPQVGCPSESCFPYSPIWNTITGINQYNYGADPGMTFQHSDADHIADDWARDGSGNGHAINAYLGEWMGVEWHLRITDTQVIMDQWIYDQLGNVEQVTTAKTWPIPSDVVGRRWNQFFIGGNNSDSYSWGSTMKSEYHIDDVIVDDQRIGVKYFQAIGVAP